MLVIIGIDPSTLGNNQICFMDGERKKPLYEVKVEGHQKTLRTIVQWVEKWRKHHKKDEFVLGIESQRNLLELAAQSLDFPVYEVNATQLNRFISGQKMARTKTDRLDAQMVCHYLSVYRDLKPYQPVSTLKAEAQAISERLTEIRERHRQVKQLFWSLIFRHAPELKQLLGSKVGCKWFKDLMLGVFLAKSFDRYGLKDLRSDCKSYSIKGNDEILSSVLNCLKTLYQNRLVAKHLVAYVRELVWLKEEEESWRKDAEAVLKDWKGYSYLESVPCMTELTGIRLLAAFGEDWSIYTAAQFSAFAGVAPEVASSGTPPRERLRDMKQSAQKRHQPKVFMRKACNRELRTVLCLFAACTIRSGWSREHYLKGKANHQRYWTTLRKLGLKWLRIMHVLVTKGKHYNPKERERMCHKWQAVAQQRLAS